MPLSRQQLQADQAGREKMPRGLGSGRQPSICASRSRSRRPPLEALFRADWERAAPRSRGDLALTAESYLRARIVVEHVLAPELTAPLTLLAACYV